MKLLLTSNGFFNDAIKEEFLKLIKCESNDMDVAIITTASPLKENNRFAQKAKEDFKEMGVKKIDFIDIEFDDPKRLLFKDVIYINGGNPYHLLFHFKQSGADVIFRNLLKTNIVILGVSAGALLLG